MTATKCKDCEGTDFVICPRCDGVGSILAEINDVDALVTCGMCRGDRDVECQTCQ